jgi:hypothetical protein
MATVTAISIQKKWGNSKKKKFQRKDINNISPIRKTKKIEEII